MPPRPLRPAALAWQVFRGSTAIHDRLLTRHQLRGASWVRLMHDVYADSRLDRDHALVCRAAALRLPSGVVVAGPSAAYLHGVEHAATFSDDVHVLAPGWLRLGSQRGIRVHTTGPHLPPSTGVVRQATTVRHGTQAWPSRLPAGQFGGRPAWQPDSQPDPDGAVKHLPSRSDPASSAWECAVWLSPVHAVRIIDTLLRQGLVSCAGLDAIAVANADRPGGRRARWVFGLADPGAQSPPESQLRVRLVLSGLPRPVTQHPVRLPSGLILHPDLAWPDYQVAVEYDGQWHVDPDQIHLDRQRLNQFVGAGWRVLHVTSRRLHHDFPRLLREVRTALTNAGWRP
ncbi:hypothetical protein SAMN05443287_114100 [Micromonospora phaseoli]|uniref:Transcriptional regulator, AbiEi antitoxin, Type IV TA system n=1 Tax=Micromonospora phaseoli TaxID=1144548 RepID=A0A1H7DK17_9ACTN|nr:hypothetical protein [Micromonospora phaseoli]PZW02379.1 hypothetical protein CLV64_102756 [Micromonospora phaseoli]GIJ75619.1 hypothetical protein Xph01_00510 [Micromonospora phaseoli]SEK01694.1 hypothetical protein SAMN05443287_114100 [Micromonospora phaseoli]